jgi:D-3-phosphoglycerate dehydrogenase / 2-oxoglutarate reductase
MMRALITTVPFGTHDSIALDMLREAGVEYALNPLGRRPTEAELCELIRDVDVLIAGTEPITSRVMASAPRLRIISRVGIGLDNVDLVAARERGIVVSYTPDAPAPAVAEFTIGLMLSLLRFIHTANARMRTDGWHRLMGRRIAELTVGIIGVGRVGRRVIGLLSGFGPRIIANDLQPSDIPGVTWVEKSRLYEEADVITLHVPLTPSTADLIARTELERMKPEAILINTSRGGIINESELATALRAGRVAAAAVDVFCHEPYAGELIGIDRCLITCHMGSMSVDCRIRMEVEATENVLQFLRAGAPVQAVPDSEYLLHASRIV